MDAAASLQRIGLFGGSFDPIHEGHLAVARGARDRLGLDRLILMVAAQSPLKKGSAAGAEDRLAMARLAVAGELGLEVSDLEVRRAGPSYTIDTLRGVAAANPRARLFLVLGSDSLATFPRWREAAALLAESTPVIAPRRGVGREALEPIRGLLGNEAAAALAAGWLDLPCVDVSATDVRARLADGRSVEGLVPKPVIAYIRERALYQQ
jgi:nicotinate-nucleotide adenylyltransferase